MNWFLTENHFFLVETSIKAKPDWLNFISGILLSRKSKGDQFQGVDVGSLKKNRDQGG